MSRIHVGAGAAEIFVAVFEGVAAEIGRGGIVLLQHGAHGAIHDEDAGGEGVLRVRWTVLRSRSCAAPCRRGSRSLPAHFNGHLVAAEGGAQLNAGHHGCATRCDHFAGYGDAFGARSLGVCCAAACDPCIARGNGDSQFVDHELGVAKTGERPDAGDHGDIVMRRCASETSSRSRSKMGWVTTYSAPASHFPIEAAQLLVEIERARDSRRRR